MKKLIMALVLMPLMALADQEKVGDVTWSYTVADGMATVTEANPSSGALIIPSTLGGCPVTSIGDYAFYTCAVTSVIIPEGVTSIGEGAFFYCHRLTSVTIPSSVTSIGSGAFAGCSGLTAILVGEGNASYCSVDGVLYDKAKTELVCFPGGETKTVTIPSGVTRIGDWAFCYCSGLTSVTIPSSVTNIGACAFYDCYRLTSVTIPSSVTNIGAGAFFNCPLTMGALILENVISIGEGAFAVDDFRPATLCVENIVLSDKLTSIEMGSLPPTDRVFVLCSTVDQDRIEEIVEICERMCDMLGGLVYPSPCRKEEEEGVSWYYYWEDPGVVICANPCKGEVVVPLRLENVPVKTLDDYAFFGCSELTSVSIPSGVTSIGVHAFYGCSSLLRVYYQGNAPSCVNHIYDGTPETLVSYVRSGTIGWSSGASADLPDSWQGRSIAHGEPPVVIDGVEWNFTTKNGKVSLGTGLVTAVGGSVSGGVTIPAEINGMKVVEIKDGAFAGLDGITSVVIPASVRTVGSKAFDGCDGLETVTFLGDAPYVYDDAFCGTKSTLAFSVPQGSIGWSDTSLTGLPGAWKGHAIQYAGGGQDAGGSAASLGTVTVSNIVVHYVLNSVQPQFAISPSQDMGFVNIITEVKSTGVAAIPMSWAMNYPNFVSKFGSDFTAALGKPTGKIGTGGTPMFVWQDYVAGTDPTNEKDVFTASITIVDGKVTISYSPELDDARKAMRKYTTWGKTSLMDTNWTEVQEGHEAEFNFFKVSVEMR